VRIAHALHLHPELVCDHGDKFGISGLSTGIMNRVAEIGVEDIHISSVPGDLNGVADGALHTG